VNSVNNIDGLLQGSHNLNIISKELTSISVFIKASTRKGNTSSLKTLTIEIQTYSTEKYNT